MAAKPNANASALYYNYKKRAKKDKRTFDLTKAEFLELTSSNCYICGAEPSSKYRHSFKLKTFAVPYIYNGIDRVDNALGYEMGNVLACCKQCNRTKSNHSLLDFLQYIHSCYKFAIEPYLGVEVANAHPDEESSRQSEDPLA